ncbi:MAG: hypothetical protein OWT28_02320 [Firmicutes bacterium]|nr:hypothetical protein [Bacillota bacterium]
MGAFHAMFGLIVIAITILLTLWNIIRISARLNGPSLRPVAMGLIDLEILFGIITFIVHPIWGAFLLHPITMLIAAVVFHIMTGKKKSSGVQLTGFILTTVLLLIGVSFASM